MRILITGVAGFIGSNLCDRLLAAGHEVVGVDNLSTGRRRFLESALKSDRFRFFENDLYDFKALSEPMLGKDIDLVFHLAANADVRDGLKQPRRDLEQNTVVTWNVLENARLAGVRRIAFSSTGSIYGEPTVFPTPEICPFPVQTSLYGASKLAGEGLISAYALGYGIQATIFRFVSILGERYTHGHVFDFVKKLKQDPSRLQVLGNGFQKKSYLYVQDCVDAMIHATQRKMESPVEIYNLGTDEYTEVNESIRTISGIMGVAPEIEYTGGERGWVGDSPFIFLDCAKIRSTGWTAKKTIRQGVTLTTEYLLQNPWVFTP